MNPTSRPGRRAREAADVHRANTTALDAARHVYRRERGADSRAWHAGRRRLDGQPNRTHDTGRN